MCEVAPSRLLPVVVPWGSVMGECGRPRFGRGGGAVAAGPVGEQGQEQRGDDGECCVAQGLLGSGDHGKDGDADGGPRVAGELVPDADVFQVVGQAGGQRQEDQQLPPSTGDSAPRSRAIADASTAV